MSNRDLRLGYQSNDGTNSFVVNEQKYYSVTKLEQRFYDLNGKILGGRDKFVLAMQKNEDMSDVQPIIRETNSHCENIKQLDRRGFPIRYETNLGLDNDDYGMEVDVQTTVTEEVIAPEEVSNDIIPMSGTLNDDEIELKDTEEVTAPEEDSKDFFPMSESLDEAELELGDTEDVTAPEEDSNDIFPMSRTLNEAELELRAIFSDSSFLTSDEEEGENGNVSDTDVNEPSETERERFARQSMSTHNYCLQEKAKAKTIDVEPNKDNVLEDNFEPCEGESLIVDLIPPKRKRGRPRKNGPKPDRNITCVRGRPRKIKPNIDENTMYNEPKQSNVPKKRQIVKKPLKNQVPKKLKRSANGFAKGYELEQIIGITRSEISGELFLYVKFKNVNEKEELPSKVVAKYAPRMLIDYYHCHLTWNE